MSDLVFINGEWMSGEDAAVSVYDHGLLYGDGVYEGIRVYGKKPLLFEPHIERLFNSSRVIGLNAPYSMSEMRKFIGDGLDLMKLDNAYVRIVLTRGMGLMGPDPSSCHEPVLIMILKDIPALHGAEQGGITTALSTVRRVSVDSSTAEIKSLNYLPSVLAKAEANRLSVDDVIMLDSNGYVAEAPVCNVFVVKDGKVKTPGRFNGILSGITRQFVIDTLQKKDVQIEETFVTPTELLSADELFLTGTHAELVMVTRHNDVEIENRSNTSIFSIVRAEYEVIKGG